MKTLLIYCIIHLKAESVCHIDFKILISVQIFKGGYKVSAECKRIKSVIWMNHPAVEDESKSQWERDFYGWNSAYPIGNGSVGAMVYGSPDLDQLQLNEETIWYGNEGRNRVNPKAKDSWKRVRQLLLEGRIKEAVSLEESDLYPIPDQQRHYDTAGSIYIKTDAEDYSDYRRSLDLEEAICSVSYKSGGHSYRREYFVSSPDRVIAFRHESLDGGLVNAVVDFSRRDERTFKYELSEYGLDIYTKQPEGGCTYLISVACEAEGGVAIFKERSLEIYDCPAFTLYIAIRSDYHGEDVKSWCRSALLGACESGYEAVRARHISDYKSYFDRAELSLDGEDYSGEPTDVRIKKAGERLDNSLSKLYFDFGRYLTISSSRPGTKPANLQGIWNKDRFPAWGSKYTININAEMNYWHTEKCNLSDCHMPLISHLKTMLPYGKKVARDMYGLDGFVAHHNTDIFGDCAPQDSCITATIWPMGAAWLSTHIWTHYEYTLDREFLKEYLPILKEVCLFFTEYMFEHDGRLLTGPSISPENSYIHPSGECGQICVGPTMDSMIIRDVFEACIKASELLGDEDSLTDKLKAMLPRLPRPEIGKYGQIMEWYEDYEETEPGHRHISHLYGLHPSSQITLEKTPKLFRAARVTIERRLASGGGHTGWSRAWIINMWARLKDGEKALENINALFTHSTYPNLFDMHPPFQIDGNFGGAAGIAEMLLQSQGGVILLLPALPKDWQSGFVRGLKARGDITVDISWGNGRIAYARLTANKGGLMRLSVPEGYGEPGISEISNDSPYTVTLENGGITVAKN